MGTIGCSPELLEWSLRPRRSGAAVVGANGDAGVLEAIRDRDERGLRAAVATYGGSVYGKALQILRHPMLAEEVAQDTFVMLWRKPESFKAHRGSLGAFLTRIARNKAIDVVRHEQVIRAKESAVAETARWLETLPADTFSDGEDAIKLRDALNSLPRTKKEALFLAYFRGLTYREVSEVLRIPEGTAKTRIRDALIMLRAAMLR